MITASGHRRCPLDARRATALGLGTILLAGGCASYRPEPVDPAAVAEAWRALDQQRATEAVHAALEGSAAPAAPAGFDLGDGIDLAEAEATALFFNPSIRATRLEIGIPTAEARHARLWEDPELGVDGDYILTDVDDPLVLGGTIGITIPLSGRRGAAKRLAEARIDEREAAALGAEWALLSTLRSEWLTLAGVEARIALLERSRSELATLIDLAPRFRAAQAVTVVDERLLRIQQHRVRDALNQAEARRDEQRLAVLALMGLHPAHDWSLRPDLEGLPAASAIASDEILAEILDHPQLRRVMAAYQVAERRLALEVRKQYPDLRIGLGGGTEEGESRILFGLGLLPIPIWNANKAGIASATVERTVASVDIESAIQDLTHRFAAAWRRKRAVDARLAFLDGELAPLIDQQVADARRLIGLGQLDLFLLADAMEQAREVRLELLGARLVAAEAALALHALTGPAMPPLGRTDAPPDPAAAP